MCSLWRQIPVVYHVRFFFILLFLFSVAWFSEDRHTTRSTVLESQTPLQWDQLHVSCWLAILCLPCCLILASKGTRGIVCILPCIKMAFFCPQVLFVWTRVLEGKAFSSEFNILFHRIQAFRVVVQFLGPLFLGLFSLIHILPLNHASGFILILHIAHQCVSRCALVWVITVPDGWVILTKFRNLFTCFFSILLEWLDHMLDIVDQIFSHITPFVLVGGFDSPLSFLFFSGTWCFSWHPVLFMRQDFKPLTPHPVLPSRS